jgi:hypothetical protein
MPVVVVSEGSTDAGDYGSDGREGCVRILTRRILEEKHGTALPPERFVRGKWARVQKRGMKATDGFRVKLAQTITFYQATRDDCEGLAVVIDRDKPRHNGKLNELDAGRQEALSNGATLAEKTAIGMAVEEVEAWLLGAYDYFHNELGLSKPEHAPEELSKPKERYTELLQELGLDPLECCDRIALNGALDNIKGKCPSFTAFAEDVASRIDTKP